VDNHDRDQIDRIVYLYGHLIDDREWDRLGLKGLLIGGDGERCRGERIVPGGQRQRIGG
jgi:hypothetical protein